MVCECISTYRDGSLHIWKASSVLKKNGDEMACLHSKPSTNWKHLEQHEMINLRRRPRTVEELEIYISQEMGQHCFKKVLKLVSLVSSHLQAVCKAEVDTIFLCSTVKNTDRAIPSYSKKKKEQE